MGLFFLLLAAICYAVPNILMKRYRKGEDTAAFGFAWYNLLFAGAGFLIAFFLRGFHLRFNAFSIGAAACAGLMLWLYNRAKVAVITEGSLTVTSLAIVTGGTAVPALFGFCILSESASFLKIAALVLITVSFIPLLAAQKSSLRFPFTHCLLYLLIFLLNGIYVCLMKAVQIRYDPSASVDYIGLMMLFYFLSSLLGLYPTVKRQAPGAFSETLTLKNFALAVTGGIANTLGGISNYQAFSYLPSTLVAIVTQTGSMLLITAFSLLIYREKPRLSVIASMALVITAIILFSFNGEV